MSLKNGWKLLCARPTVTDDWRVVLSPEKQQVFRAALQNWDSYYGMMSVALNDAFELRHHNRLPLAAQQAAVSGELMSLFAAKLVTVLHTINQEARHFSAPPTVEPLNPSFFRGERAKETATWNHLLFHVLLGERSRFFHKIHSLIGVIEGISEDFTDAATEIAEGASIHPGASWDALDHLHYDSNTCLRESEVLLKSFLRAWPGRNIEAFAEKMTSSIPISSIRTRAKTHMSHAG